MRWRIATGVLAFGLAVAIYFASQPRKGTVEWHKREYLTTQRKLLGVPARPRLTGFFYRITGRRQPERALLEKERSALLKHSEASRTALVEANYLVRRKITLSNCEPKDIAVTLMKIPPVDVSQDYQIFTLFSWNEGGAKTIEVFGIADDMPKWESEIRKLDVPQAQSPKR